MTLCISAFHTTAATTTAPARRDRAQCQGCIACAVMRASLKLTEGKDRTERIVAAEMAVSLDCRCGAGANWQRCTCEMELECRCEHDQTKCEFFDWMEHSDDCEDCTGFLDEDSWRNR